MVDLADETFTGEELLEQGFTVIRGAFGADEIAKIRRMSDAMSSRAGQILAEAARANISVATRAMLEDGDLIVVPEAQDRTKVCRYEFMCGYSSEFSAFVSDVVKPVAEALLGRKLAVFKDKTNEKAPGGGAFGPHQDHEAYKVFGPTYFVTALIGVAAANHENGCLEFAPDYRRHAAEQNVLSSIDGYPIFKSVSGGPHHGEIDPSVAELLEWQPLPTGPGDLVIFDSFVPHRSRLNLSERPRRAIFVTMNPADQGALYDHYYREKRTNYNDAKFHVATPTWRGDEG